MTPRKQFLLDIVRWVYVLGYRDWQRAQGEHRFKPDSVPFWEGKMKLLIQEAVSNGQLFTMEIVSLVGSGRIYYLHLSVSPVSSSKPQTQNEVSDILMDF